MPASLVRECTTLVCAIATKAGKVLVLESLVRDDSKSLLGLDWKKACRSKNRGTRRVKLLLEFCFLLLLFLFEVPKLFFFSPSAVLDSARTSFFLLFSPFLLLDHQPLQQLPATRGLSRSRLIYQGPVFLREPHVLAADCHALKATQPSNL